MLLLPLQRNGALIGYLRLGLDTTRLEHLYTALRRRLFFGALGGLVLVAGLSYAVHLQLRRRNDQLVAALERAARGGEGFEAAPSMPAELDPALAVAGRLGRELQQERRRNVAAGRRLQRLATMMDVGLVLLSRERQVEFAAQRGACAAGVAGRALPRKTGAPRWRPWKASCRTAPRTGPAATRQTSRSRAWASLAASAARSIHSTKKGTPATWCNSATASCCMPSRSTSAWRRSCAP